MYNFKPCTYDELQKIRASEDLYLSGWQLLDKVYINETKKIYDESNNKMIALIHYEFPAKNKMQIDLFEVFSKYQRQGYGKKIISQFVSPFHGYVINLIPDGEGAEIFWKKCGFSEDGYLLVN